ncbi:cupin domain-containing protein [Kamptonema cortianum]|nr:cupin domain-containing protein [Desertifilum sp.]MDI9638649.1 cupin domain-containing protein [Geitlerinema splendidum]MDK3159824.1 cupin domain-containing protein [Kamptonema cortianum]
MSLKKQLQISSLECIRPTAGVEICPLDRVVQSGNTIVEPPLLSHETTLVTIAPGTVEDLFVHHYQTDQLLVVQGSVVLVALLDRQYQYILLRGEQPTLVKIPPGVPHGAINLSQKSCVAINSILRHGPVCDRDYRPVKKPFPYELSLVRELLTGLSIK